mmetsp:Transcript_28380/g.85570  ORF Transcript_28380/g.85570 Transcript_28380/m.85570 type:complete len:282 (+) Transcript_28380:966-1811(+)
MCNDSRLGAFAKLPRSALASRWSLTRTRSLRKATDPVSPHANAAGASNVCNVGIETLSGIPFATSRVWILATERIALQSGVHSLTCKTQRDSNFPQTAEKRASKRAQLFMRTPTSAAPRSRPCFCTWRINGTTSGTCHHAPASERWLHHTSETTENVGAQTCNLATSRRPSPIAAMPQARAALACLLASISPCRRRTSSANLSSPTIWSQMLPHIAERRSASARSRRSRHSASHEARSHPAPANIDAKMPSSPLVILPSYRQGQPGSDAGTPCTANKCDLD